MLKHVYDTLKNNKNKNNKSNDKRLLRIAQLCLSAVLKRESKIIGTGCKHL